MEGERRGRWAVAAAAALLAVALRPAASQAQVNDPFLAEQPWREQAYGLSLHPPRDAKHNPVTGDDAIARFDGAQRYTVKVFIKKSNLDLSIPVSKDDTRPPIVKVAHTAVGQLAAANPQAVVLEQRTLVLAGKPAALLFFKVPDARANHWALGQAFVELGPKTFALIQLEAAWDRYKFVRPVFDAMLASVRVQAAEDVAQHRKEMINNGIVWRRALNADQLHAAIVPEQLLRIVEGDQTIGWMRVTQMRANGWEQPPWRAQKEKEMAAQRGKEPKRIVVPGVLVDVQARINVGPRAFDTDSRFFFSDNAAEEIWTSKTTVRPIGSARVKLGADPRNNADAAAVSWAETGVRDGDLITVSQESPTSVKKFQWERPSEEKGSLYLSQVELYLIGGLLPRNVPMNVGFYNYYSKTGTVTFRTERVAPGPNGTVTLHSRPTPDEPEQVTTYDRDGRLTHRTLPNGWQVVPTTRAELGRLFAGTRFNTP